MITNAMKRNPWEDGSRSAGQSSGFIKPSHNHGCGYSGLGNLVNTLHTLLKIHFNIIHAYICLPNGLFPSDFPLKIWRTVFMLGPCKV